MKVWHGFGSEHSANLIMIGSFATPEDAEVAVKELAQLRDRIQDAFDYDRFDDNPMSVYEDGPLREILMKFDLYNFSYEDIEHLTRDHTVRRIGSQMMIHTDELDVNGFLKFMIDKHIRVEVCSAHDFPDASPGQTERSENRD